MSVLIRSLNFTKSVGKRDTPHDVSFSDIVDVGMFPFEQKIKNITEIKVYADSPNNKDETVIVGLEVTYGLTNGDTYTVHRGLVNETLVADFGIGDNQLLVGVYGRLKNYPTSDSHERLAAISFVLFDKVTASVRTEGPFPEKPTKLGTPWGCFGKIVAFQGTRADKHGITSLGFAKNDSEEGEFSTFAADGQP